MDGLNANKLSSALDFFGDNLQQDDNGAPIPDNPVETHKLKNKETKQLKRKQDSSKDLEEDLQAKKVKLKSGTKIFLLPW